MSLDPLVFVLMLVLGLAAFLLGLVYMVFKAVGGVLRGLGGLLRGRPKGAARVVALSAGRVCGDPQCRHVEPRPACFCSQCGKRLE
ncbi:MAG TPA: hypothetical protein PKK06_17005 [Phycisphaerae bacterium]|nr:hypothetical protein [Phycisphaerae bacterium]HNU46227.1 hypothetical protein [Phycisphaerae bacterium]